MAYLLVDLLPKPKNMSEKIFKPGDIVEHVHFGFELFVVKILETGAIGCRYKSGHHNEKSVSERILHYMDFEVFELKEPEKKGLGAKALSGV